MDYIVQHKQRETGTCHLVDFINGPANVSSNTGTNEEKPIYKCNKELLGKFEFVTNVTTRGSKHWLSRQLIDPDISENHSNISETRKSFIFCIYFTQSISTKVKLDSNTSIYSTAAHKHRIK